MWDAVTVLLRGKFSIECIYQKEERSKINTPKFLPRTIEEVEQILSKVSRRNNKNQCRNSRNQKQEIHGESQ